MSRNKQGMKTVKDKKNREFQRALKVRKALRRARREWAEGDRSMPRP